MMTAVNRVIHIIGMNEISRAVHGEHNEREFSESVMQRGQPIHNCDTRDFK